ncbi:hypothetical protein BA011_36725 (plasmid) [Rhizobium leguminosarum]|uniref:Uncharacterized protein n=1 Tax=Rhizobium leguminosarum TaxID=384 RepID=A0A179BYK7_RHILE|nr:hypothetical protein BA011_36725 [Rhizobium leguminosarum]OAP96253.1 hypothetical protein A4U53_38515 [Rhizobium leguminosarum]
MIAVATSEPFTLVKIPLARIGGFDLVLLLQLDEVEDFLHQVTAGGFVIPLDGIEHGHRKCIACSRHETGNVLANVADAPGRRFDIAFSVWYLSANREEVVVVRGPQPFEGNIGFKPGLLHQPLVTARNGFRHRELVGRTLTEIFEPADRRVAGERRCNEARLALIVLPHRRIQGSLRGIGKDIDLIMLVALTHDPALALFDV